MLSTLQFSAVSIDAIVICKHHLSWDVDALLE